MTEERVGASKEERTRDPHAVPHLLGGQSALFYFRRLGR